MFPDYLFGKFVKTYLQKIFLVPLSEKTNLSQIFVEVVCVCVYASVCVCVCVCVRVCMCLFPSTVEASPD